jgi:hypothetical protein
MDRAQRKRRAIIGAMALLEWRDQVAREEARELARRANAERAMTARFELMIAAMRVQADAPRAASRAPIKTTVAMVCGNGAAGVTS